MNQQRASRLVSVPHRLRRVSAVGAVALVFLFTVLALALPAGSGRGQFHRADEIAVFVLGLVCAGLVLLIARPRVEADEDGVRVRNILRSHRLSWAVVAAVRFEPGEPWASLEVHDDDSVPVMAVQAADGPSAQEAVAELRRLLLAHPSQGGQTGS